MKNFPLLLNSFRFFHIDGCHSGKNIYKDLSLVDNLVSSDGIVVVDDFFSFTYPQITESLYKYLQMNPYSFRIFCVGFNKAYLCRPEYFNKYYSHCLNKLQIEFIKMQMYICIKKTSGLGDSYTLSVCGFDIHSDIFSPLVAYYYSQGNIPDCDCRFPN